MENSRDGIAHIFLPGNIRWSKSRPDDSRRVAGDACMYYIGPGRREKNSKFSNGKVGRKKLFFFLMPKTKRMVDRMLALTDQIP